MRKIETRQAETSVKRDLDEPVWKIVLMIVGNAPEPPFLRNLAKTGDSILRKDRDGHPWEVGVKPDDSQDPKSPFWITMKGSDPQTGENVTFGILTSRNVKKILGVSAQYEKGSALVSMISPIKYPPASTLEGEA